MKLYGIYHANGGLLGELAYVVGKISGRTHCALCDITHGAIRAKTDFKVFQQEIPIPFETLHLNEQSAELQNFSQDQTPCVVLQRGSEFELLLGPEDLESCGGSVALLKQKILRHLDGAV